MREINLSGPQGNVFAIAGIAQTWNKQLGNGRHSILIEADRRHNGVGDYIDVLNIFDEWFKDIVSYEFINDPRNPETSDPDAWD
jgi:hypothetical protein